MFEPCSGVFCIIFFVQDKINSSPKNVLPREQMYAFVFTNKLFLFKSFVTYFSRKGKITLYKRITDV